MLLFLLTCGGRAEAIEIGNLHVSSHLGEPLKASIPIIATQEEEVSSSCVSLVRSESDNGIFQLTHAKLEMQNEQGKQVLWISTRDSMNEPIIMFQLSLHCSSDGVISKSFTVFLDPPAFRKPASPVIPVAQAPAVRLPEPEKPVRKGEIVVHSGDTLSGFALRRYPENAFARRRYIAALLMENPGIVPNRLQVGAVLRDPDMKSYHAPLPKPAEIQKPHPVEAPKQAPKQAFRLNIATETPPQAQKDAAKPTETQLIAQSDNQTVQLKQLRDQVKSLEEKLTELQGRLTLANRLLARLNTLKTQPREESSSLPNLILIAAILLILAISGGVSWYLRKKKAQTALMEQYLNPAPASRPALIDHLDYFESDTPDHHKW
ncbi:MAG: hypothetical protein HKL98_06830 [Burkholderiales bacterium]|nr:hypothetical protein [Burkholderiales bacterium]